MIDLTCDDDDDPESFLDDDIDTMGPAPAPAPAPDMIDMIDRTCNDDGVEGSEDSEHVRSPPDVIDLTCEG